jgi:hypothetical protein
MNDTEGPTFTAFIVMEPAVWITMLNRHIVEVTFKKANGDTRVMKATLMKDHLPSIEEKPQYDLFKSSSAIRCFDIDKQEWRSFRPDTVTAYRTI